ncbi:MAG TPA: hypothetical protein VM938_02805 [Acidimicrobiales bacterium]|nr:hypothetical protein [Acidimicrobiales bacterium]
MDDVERLLADLARWTGDRRAADEARSRSEEAWLRRQADEEARFTGLVLDLAEQGAAVTVQTTAGRRHHGTVVAVADDFLVLDAHRPVLLAYRAVAVVRSTAGVAGATRVAPLGTRLVHALAGIAAERPRVLVVVDGNDALHGELRSVGRDVLALRLDGADGAAAHVRLDAVSEVTLLG